MEVVLIIFSLLNPIHEDDRGRFLRAWYTREFAEHATNFLPVQANLGCNKERGTVRGMHFQEAPAVEAKLVRCTGRDHLRRSSGRQAGVANRRPEILSR
jgi:dTDP-4-dehydrorhamnose 3,5-epimerase-like enzyme